MKKSAHKKHKEEYHLKNVGIFKFSLKTVLFSSNLSKLLFEYIDKLFFLTLRIRITLMANSLRLSEFRNIVDYKNLEYLCSIRNIGLLSG